jgi:hypothetical protein
LIPVLRRIYFNYPDPFSLACANRSDIEFLLAPIGSQAARAMRIQRMSYHWVEIRKKHGLDHLGPHRGQRKVRGHPIKFYQHLPGVDDYGQECIKIFVNGDLSFEPKDPDLQKYVTWARDYYKDYLTHEIFQRRLQGITVDSADSNHSGTADGNSHRNK